MKIRRLQYNIEYTHIITFKEEYKQAILPYFGFDNLRYAIDNENTINESIRLIFSNETLALFIRKEGISFLFEGDVTELKNQTGAIKFFWDIYDNIKTFKGFKKTNRHNLIVHSVEIKDKSEVSKILEAPPVFNVNPFGSLEEFASVYEFKKDDKMFKFTFGNYSEKDISVNDLTPFNTEYNEDLHNNFGLMSKLEIFEECTRPSFNRFKTLLLDAENTISSYKIE